MNRKIRKRVPTHLLFWESPDPFSDAVCKTERMLLSSRCSAFDSETQPPVVTFWLTRWEELQEKDCIPFLCKKSIWRSFNTLAALKPFLLMWQSNLTVPEVQSKEIHSSSNLPAIAKPEALPPWRKELAGRSPCAETIGHLWTTGPVEQPSREWPAGDKDLPCQPAGCKQNIWKTCRQRNWKCKIWLVHSDPCPP